MPTLQRSCDPCVAAKRRCNLATPRCARCTTKKITCTYINHPAAATSNRQRAWHGTIRKYRLLHAVGRPLPASPSKLTFELGPILGLQTYTSETHVPEVVRLFSPMTLERQLSILQTFVVHFAQHGAASFLHPYLYESQLPEALEHASRICASYMYGLKEEQPFVTLKPGDVRSQASQMLRLAARAASFPELVAHVQAIAFLQIICLLLESEAQEHLEQQESEREDKLFWELAMILWVTAPVQLPRMLSPWRAWLFAESVRRTILVCHIILAVRSALRRGYAVHLLCVEALPFDMRAPLWDADTADAWEAATAASHEQPSLVSLRQFTVLQKKPARTMSSFEDLLLLFFKQRDYSDI